MSDARVIEYGCPLTSTVYAPPHPSAMGVPVIDPAVRITDDARYIIAAPIATPASSDGMQIFIFFFAMDTDCTSTLI